MGERRRPLGSPPERSRPRGEGSTTSASAGRSSSRPRAAKGHAAFEPAQKAISNGITPAWHTGRSAYAIQNDTQWTRSDNLPAYVIEKTGTFASSPATAPWTPGGAAPGPCIPA